MWFLGKRIRRERLKQSLFRRTELDRVLPPEDGQLPKAYVSLPQMDIPSLVDAYVTAIETQRTDDICRCEWSIHPDDIGLPKGKRRKRRVDTHPTCPVHTKEGFLIYFFEWIFTR